MGASLITYQGKEIIYIDYGECQTNEQLMRILMETELLEESMPSPVLMLADFRGLLEGGQMLGNFDFIKKNIEMVEIRKQSGKTIYAASINVHQGMKRFLFSAYLTAVDKSMNMSFLTKQEALDWLVSR